MPHFCKSWQNSLRVELILDCSICSRWRTSKALLLNLIEFLWTDAKKGNKVAKAKKTSCAFKTQYSFNLLSLFTVLLLAWTGPERVTTVDYIYILHHATPNSPYCIFVFYRFFHISYSGPFSFFFLLFFAVCLWLSLPCLPPKRKSSSPVSASRSLSSL